MTTTAGSMLACHRDGAVATVTIHHPPANTLTPELLGELSQAFEMFATDEAIKVVVLTGTGRFSLPGRTSVCWPRLPPRRKAHPSRGKGRLS